MSDKANHPEKDELPRNGDLSRLYRQEADLMPPPALDARILAAAASAVKSTPAKARPLPWWRRWAAPVGVLATMTLTVVLVLEMQRAQEVLISSPPPAAAPAQKMSPRPAVAEPAAPAKAGHVATTSSDVAPPATLGASTVARGADAVSGTAAADRPAAASPGNGMPVEARRSAAPAVAADLATEARKEVAPAAPAASAPLLKDAARNRLAPAGEAVMEGYVAKPGTAPRLPEPWLADIRRLKDAGRLAEAAEQLRRFREAYPDYRLPEDLREPR